MNTLDAVVQRFVAMTDVVTFLYAKERAISFAAPSVRNNIANGSTGSEQGQASANVVERN